MPMKPRMSGMAEVARGDLGGGQVEVVDAELAGLAEDRVVDVGDVADEPDLVAAVDEAALEHVVGDVHRGVPEVGGVVRRDAARVHRHDGPRLEGHHRLLGGAPEPDGRLGHPSTVSAGVSAGGPMWSMPVNLMATRVL
jgi:hypothetical protein